MRNYEDSDYALNKYSKGIVYRFADSIVEITLADYLTENPVKTEEDFLVLKGLSDSIYFEQVKNENARTKKNLPFYETDETLFCQLPSPEEMLIDELSERVENERRQERLGSVKQALDKLTEAQRRRYLLYAADGLTTREIAEKEKTAQRTVMDSIQQAEKKIKKFFGGSKK